MGKAIRTVLTPTWLMLTPAAAIWSATVRKLPCLGGLPSFGASQRRFSAPGARAP
jgi:hypothetical protein